MKVSVSKTAPSGKELAEILNREFSNRYSYELFGLGDEKSVIVQKSAFVGVQISKRQNEFDILITPPSITSGYLLVGVSFVPGLDLVLGWALRPQFLKLEREIAGFLNQRYN
jgi:hypothetical protein